MPMDIGVLLDSCGDLGWQFCYETLDEARSEKTLSERDARAGDRFDNHNLSKSDTRSYTHDASPVRINGKGQPVRTVIVGDSSNTRRNGVGMSDDMRQKYREAAKKLSDQVAHEKETLDMMNAANVPKDDESHKSQQEVVAKAEQKRDIVNRWSTRDYHVMAGHKTPEQKLDKHRRKSAIKKGDSESKSERAETLRKQTEANAAGDGGKQARAQRRVERRERRRRYREWSATPEPAPQPASASTSTTELQPAPAPSSRPPTQSITSQQSSPPPQQTPPSPTPATPNKPKFQIKGKHVAGAALAVTGVTAAGLAARHIYKKRQERKRKEREAAEEAAEREARKPINRLKRVFTQH